MRPTIIVGYDGGKRSADALALGRALAPPASAELIAACIHAGPLERSPAERERLLHHDASHRLAPIPDDGTTTKTVVASSSAAHGLLDLADRERAELLVIGSSHRASPGETRLGQVGRALLGGAPCGVAIAPSGYADAPIAAPSVIGVGFDDSAQSWLALRAAIRLAQRCPAQLRLISVVHVGELSPYAASLGGDDACAEIFREQARRRLEHALQRVPMPIVAVGHVVVGPPAEALRRDAVRGCDLLVLGSRGYGALRRALLGSAALLRSAPCPVVVIPDGADVDLAEGPARPEALRSFAHSR